MLVNIRFQVLFHSPPGVLFTFPSQYFFTIGHQVVFRLGGWAPHIPYGFHVSVGTPDKLVHLHFRLRDSHSLWYTLPNAFDFITDPFVAFSLTPKYKYFGLASFAFARHYSRNLGWFLFLLLLRCFSSEGSLLTAYIFHRRYISSSLCVFPHSEIRGSRLICSSPRLIAACHVFHRLLMPRHSPYALLYYYSFSHMHKFLRAYGPSRSLSRIAEYLKTVFVFRFVFFSPFSQLLVRLKLFFYPLMLNFTWKDQIDFFIFLSFSLANLFLLAFSVFRVLINLFSLLYSVFNEHFLNLIIH